MRRLRSSLLGNLFLLAGSIAATMAVLEFVVFGLLLQPDDVLPNVTIDGVVRYLPGTEASFRHPDGSSTRVTINADGWNSSKPFYVIEPSRGRGRVAVIGDSYVHASFVDPGEAYPERLERKLVGSGIDAEVYRFGMDGAPLSQYLNVLRREVVKYKPDVVVVGLIHNDFDESYRFLKTRTASSFLKLEIEDGAPPREVPPADFTPGAADLLRSFAMFRYLYYETGLYLSARATVSRLFWGGDEDYRPEHISSAVDVRRISDHDRNREAARYVMAEMKALAARHGFALVFVMDAVREAIYAGHDAESYEVGALNHIAAGVAEELGLTFLDLGKAFAADWKANGKRFEFAYDWHWNAHGNEVVAEALSGVVAPILRRVPQPANRRISGQIGATPDGG